MHLEKLRRASQKAQCVDVQPIPSHRAGIAICKTAIGCTRYVLLA